MFKANEVGDGYISVTHSGFKYLLVSRSQARRMGLGGGSWEMVPATEQEQGCWLKRSKNGKRVVVYMRHPEDIKPHLVRDFCWDLFSKTTGLKLEPGEFGKYRLEAQGV